MLRAMLGRGLFSVKKKIYSPEETKNIIINASGKVQKIASITLGPYGRNVLIQNEMQNPRITKDGVTVVKHIEFENRLEDCVCSLIKNSVNNTNKFAGDGTTTSTVMIGEILKIAHRKLATGESLREIRKGLEIGRKLSIDFLDSCCRKVETREELMNVAMIATNKKQNLAELIAEAVSAGGIAKVEKSNRAESYLEYYSGLKFARGMQSKQFSNTAQGKLIYNYPLIATSSLPINSVKQILKCLQLAKKARKQLLIFAPNFSESVKSALIYNNKKKIVEACYISVPEYGQVGKNLIKKIAAMSSSVQFGEFNEKKIEAMEWEDFGKAIKVEIDDFQTKMEVKATEQNQSLSVTIYVGGHNETQQLENYDHAVDALNSAKSAKKHGVVAGGGITFWRLSQLLAHYSGEGQAGVKILAEALKQPRKKLMQFVPVERQPLSGEEWKGYDLKTEKIVDMFEAGIIDSVNVAKSTIIDSVSLCTVLIEVEIGIARTDRNVSSISLKQLNKKYSL